MAILKLTSEIVDQDTKVWLSWDGFESTSSDDIVKFIEGIPSDDGKIIMRINCPGGNVFEGWRMYDALRQSGKEITAVVEGMCASMATVLLMAAPKERRISYPNATFLIHNPEVSGIRTGGYPERLTADEIDKMADNMKLQADALRAEQEKILDLYVERTGADRAELQELMDKDITIKVDRAIELGLISETLAPNTARLNNLFNKQTMSKENKVEVGQSWLDRLLARAGFKSVEDVHFNDLSFTAADGRTFAVEREEGLYAIGDKASPDGEYVMEDGTTVNIINGAITEIVAAEFEIKNPETGATITSEEAQHLLDEYIKQIADLKEKLENANTAAADAADEAVRQIDALNATIAEKDTKIADFEANAINDEQKQMLNVISEAGGKEWFDAIVNKQSDGAPKTPQGNMPNAKIGDDFIADLQKNNKRFR